MNFGKSYYVGPVIAWLETSTDLHITAGKSKLKFK
jgi:hypothetical protein